MNIVEEKHVEVTPERGLIPIILVEIQLRQISQVHRNTYELYFSSDRLLSLLWLNKGVHRREFCPYRLRIRHGLLPIPGSQQESRLRTPENHVDYPENDFVICLNLGRDCYRRVLTLGIQLQPPSHTLPAKRLSFPSTSNGINTTRH